MKRFKVFVLVIALLGAFTLILSGCGGGGGGTTSTSGGTGGGGGGGTGGGGGSGLLEGSSLYVGPYPNPVKVTFTTKDGRNMTVTAFPGQVQVFFAPTTTDADATKAIQSLGGTILSKIPKIHYYMVKVPHGTESSFIASLLTLSIVEYASPHIAAHLKYDPMQYCNTPNAICISPDLTQMDFNYCQKHPEDTFLCQTVPVNISGSGVVVLDVGFTENGHGYGVSKTAKDNGGTVPGFVSMPHFTCTKEACDGIEGEVTPTDMGARALVAVIEGNTIYNSNQPIVINISSNGAVVINDDGTLNAKETLDSIEVFLTTYLKAISNIPDEKKNNIVVNFAIGNEKLDITSVLENIRKDPKLADTLSKYVFLVGTNQEFSNYVSGKDPNVLVVNNPEAKNGTSFAAPFASAIMDQLIKKGYSMQQIISACKKADDKYGELTLENVINELTNTAPNSPNPQPEPRIIFTGPFTGSTTEVSNVATIQYDIIAYVTISILSGDGTLIDPYKGIMKIEGSIIATCTANPPWQCKESTVNVPFSLEGTIYGPYYQIEGSAGDGQVTFTHGYINTIEDTLTGTLTFDVGCQYACAEPIVKNVTLIKK